MKRNFDNAEVLLKVENLCQYFKMGKGELKAVNNVNFDIKRGEVFGLVGESGCGKTTTGRTIIKLYEATSGNVYFKDERIVAGTRSYKEEIFNKKKELKAAVSALKAEYAQKIADCAIGDDDAADVAKKAAVEQQKTTLNAELKGKISALENEASDYIAERRDQIRKANFDSKNCDKKFADEAVAKVTAEYDQKVADLVASGASIEQVSALKKERADKIRRAKKSKLVTQIQMIYQDPIASLDPRMTVREIISEGLVIQGVRDKEEIDEKVYRMLELVGLVREHAGRYPHEFSGGQRQRIGIARSVIMNPELIIADEPVSALDVSIQAQVINLLNELREKMGLTILFIAHDLSVVKYFSDRIGVMYYGNMVELATSDELFAHPLHPYTKSLLSAIPLPDPHYEKERVRITYNPLAEHDYSVNKPSMREVAPGHFVMCNDEEEAKYKAVLADNN